MEGPEGVGIEGPEAPEAFRLGSRRPGRAGEGPFDSLGEEPDEGLRTDAEERGRSGKAGARSAFVEAETMAIGAERDGGLEEGAMGTEELGAAEEFDARRGDEFVFGGRIEAVGTGAGGLGGTGGSGRQTPSHAQPVQHGAEETVEEEEDRAFVERGQDRRGEGDGAGQRGVMGRMEDATAACPATDEADGVGPDPVEVEEARGVLEPAEADGGSVPSVEADGQHGLSGIQAEEELVVQGHVEVRRRRGVEAEEGDGPGMDSE